MARLAIKKDILRALLLKSKNQCAYPDCRQPLISEDNVFIGNICHIEAAKKGAPRYNPKQTDEDRRSCENLILFCYKHHKVTDDEQKFPVDALKKIKKDHETKQINDFDENRIVQALEKLQRTQQKFAAILQNLLNQSEIGIGSTNYEGYYISTSENGEIWLPEQGKFYRDVWPDGSHLEYMMKGNVLCINHTFPDGAIAYYEMTEDGSVKEVKLPYPIEEYSVEIPEDMLVRTDIVDLPNGWTQEKHVLKFGRSVTLFKDKIGTLKEVNIQARAQVFHHKRLFRILGTRDT